MNLLKKYYRKLYFFIGNKRMSVAITHGLLHSKSHFRSEMSRVHMAKKLKTDFILPGANAVVLTTELADQLVDHMIADKQNRFNLYVLAAGILRAYLTKKTDTGSYTYSDEFENCYRENELDQVFGDAPNFRKFASAGEVVGHVSKMDNTEKYLDQLPVSKGTLYECSLILQPPNDLASIMRKNFTAG